MCAVKKIQSTLISDVNCFLTFVAASKNLENLPFRYRKNSVFLILTNGFVWRRSCENIFITHLLFRRLHNLLGLKLKQQNLRAEKIEFKMSSMNCFYLCSWFFSSTFIECRLNKKRFSKVVKKILFNNLIFQHGREKISQ